MGTGGDDGIGCVELEVTFGTFKSMGADVEVSNRSGSTARGVKGETAGETEGIEDTATLGEGSDHAAVFALIEEKPGFLSSNDVGLKLDA